MCNNTTNLSQTDLIEADAPTIPAVTTPPIPADRPTITNITEGSPKLGTKGELPPEFQIAISDAIIKVKDSLTANFVMILAIFASFITFLGIEVQILKNICDYWRILGFSFFILATILIFVFAIFIFVDYENSKSWQKIIGMFAVVGILFAGAFYSLSKSEDEYVCKLTQLNNRFEELDIQYSEKNNQAIQDIKERLNSIETKDKSK